MKEQQQPGSPLVEGALLASILIDSGILPEIMESLSVEHFYDTRHQVIYAVMLALFQKNEPIDLVMVTQRLRDQKTLTKAGGAAYLSHLLENPIAIDPGHSAKMIREKAMLRQLIQKTTEVYRMCFSAQDDVDGVFEFAEKAIFSVSSAKILPSFFQSLDILPASMKLIEERNEKRGITGLSSGFSHLDNLTGGFQPSDLIILAARPSMGKTAFALNIATHVACERTVAFFSLEMSKEQLMLRLLCSDGRVDLSVTKERALNQSEWENFHSAGTRLGELRLFIDDTPAQSALQIRAKCRRLKKSHDLSLVVVDYLQLMAASESAERRDLAIAEISGAMKALAKELDIPVIALSQLNRKLEDRADKRPILSDLRESGSLEQDADMVVFIYRDEVYNRDEANPNKGLAEVLLRKHRNGPVGDVRLRFYGGYTRFEDITCDDYVAGY